MAYREVTRADIQEFIRRWQAGEGYRRIASGTGLSRNTVRKYLTAAAAERIAKNGTAPTDEQLCRPTVIGQSRPRQAGTPSEELLSRAKHSCRPPLLIEKLRTGRVGWRTDGIPWAYIACIFGPGPPCTIPAERGLI